MYAVERSLGSAANSMLQTAEALRTHYLFDDGEALAASMNLGATTLASLPEANNDLGRARTHYARLLARGLTYKRPGRVNWRVPASAPRLSPGAISQLRRLGWAVDALLVTVNHEIAEDERLQRRLGFPLCEQERALAVYCRDAPPAYFKVDLTLDADGALKMFEIGTVIIGLGIGQALRETYGPHRELPGIAPCYEEAVLAGYERDCRARGRVPVERPLGLAPIETAADDRQELFVLAAALERLELVVCPWSAIRWLGPPVLRDGRQPDLIHRRFMSPAPRLADYTVRLLARDLCCWIVNPWNDVLGDKRMLALVHHPEAAEALPGLSKDALETLRSFAPRTWLADVERLGSVRDLPRSARRYYLKRARSHSSHAVRDGDYLNRGAWGEACDQALRDGDWILQEAVRGKPWPFRYLGEDGVSLEEMNGYVRFTPYFFRRHDGTIRLGEVVITARERCSRVHGASDAVIVVPVE
jgi:hypothetical protein